jgi:hypothetical protein
MSDKQRAMSNEQRVGVAGNMMREKVGARGQNDKQQATSNMRGRQRHNTREGKGGQEADGGKKARQEREKLVNYHYGASP